MKKIILLITVIFLVASFQTIIAQRVEMKIGEKIEINEKVNKKGKKTGAILFKQNNQKLKYIKMFKTLEGLDVCAGNMKLARKHRNGTLVIATIGVITWPLGYLILIGPILSKKKKEIKYVKSAIEQYNKSLK